MLHRIECLEALCAAAICVIALRAPPATADTIFRDGFETPCNSQDLDGDRLTGCQELAWLTSETDDDTDDDGLSDGD